MECFKNKHGKRIYVKYVYDPTWEDQDEDYYIVYLFEDKDGEKPLKEKKIRSLLPEYTVSYDVGNKIYLLRSMTSLYSIPRMVECFIDRGYLPTRKLCKIRHCGLVQYANARFHNSERAHLLQYVQKGQIA